ncbi:hypothetical protein SNE40_017108 [Patella caerulea]|uniref:Mitochondrial ribosomal protein L41 n=1 Tax=Patella caerulea TaxID=87958 RepID=A0AAN8J9T9_PATCE
MFSVNCLTNAGLKSAGLRYISSTSCLCGKKSRVPFDKRFPVTAKMVNRHRKGGNKALEMPVAKHVVQPTGIIEKATGKFVKVPEMIPEFIVPDLTDFPLKPYVSYKATEITQTEFTAKDLFDACYAGEIVTGVKEGKVQIKDGKVISDSKTKLPES